MTVFAAIQLYGRKIPAQLAKIPFFDDHPAPRFQKGPFNEVRREAAVIHDGPHGLELTAPFDGALEHGVKVEDIVTRLVIPFKILAIVAAAKRNAAQGCRHVGFVVDEMGKSPGGHSRQQGRHF